MKGANAVLIRYMGYVFNNKNRSANPSGNTGLVLFDFYKNYP